MSQVDTDILIIGGGLAGLATAISVAQLGLRCTVIDKGTRAQAEHIHYDGRASAISEASVRLLKGLHAWEYMAHEACAIEDILVVDGFSDAKVHFDHCNVGNVPFGYIIPNTTIRSALLKRADNLANVTLLFETDIKSYNKTSHDVGIVMGDDTTITARLMLACDGRFSTTREWMGIEQRTTLYGQTAIVCTIAHEKPHQNIAVERFMPRGPFAILPMTNNRSCIVWTEPDAMAKHMMALDDDDAFLEELVLRSGDYLGEIALVSDRYAYPLSLVSAKKYIEDRCALVGDAAHGIHPIAGQGINLGYRDVAALSDVLKQAIAVGSDIGSATVLEHYQQWRSFDATSMGMVMDGLVRLFSNDAAPVRHARRLGLKLVEQFAPSKQFFMMHSMGLLGDLPELLQEEHAA